MTTIRKSRVKKRSLFDRERERGHFNFSHVAVAEPCRMTSAALFVAARKAMPAVTRREYKVVIIADGQQLSSARRHRRYGPAASSFLAIYFQLIVSPSIDRLVLRLAIALTVRPAPA